MTEKSNHQGISWKHPASLIATWFGVGKIGFAPGTFGSIAAFPLFILSHYLLCFGKSENSFTYIYIAFLCALFLVGQWASNVYMKKTGKTDPGEIVIDEVVGQMIVWFAAFSALTPHIGLFDILYGTASEHSQQPTIASLHEIFTLPEFLRNYLILLIPTYAAGFLLFRLFDIWKPFPIKWCDKNIKGGFGVMFDDVFASIYACIALLIAILAFLLYFVPPPQEVDTNSTEIIQ